MFKNSRAFSGFAVDDLAAAKHFYGSILGVDVEEGKMGLTLKLAGGTSIFVYPKETHTPATFTILNFPVEDIAVAVAELKSKGVQFEQYDLGGGATTDKDGIMRGRQAGQGPDIAWFKDPAGNILSVLQD